MPTTLAVRPAGRLGTGILGLLAVVGLVAVGAGKLGDLLPSVPNPFATETVDRTQPPVLESLVELHEYRAASANFQVIVDTEKDSRWIPSFLRGERTVFVAGGSVGASVDFSTLDERAVQVSSDRRSVTVVLPAPVLSEPRVDAGASRVVSRERGLLDRIGGVFSDTPTDDQPLYVAAETKMRQAAAASDLRVQAEENTRRMLQGLLGSLGFTHVTVSFGSTI